MIVYEVNVTLEEEIREHYLLWLEEHIKSMLKFSGFLSASLLYDMDCPLKVTVVYRIKNENALKIYMASAAPTMRRQAVDRFGDRFSITRRVFRIEKEF